MATNDESEPKLSPGVGADQKVKDLIDAATRAELEKWFGLPSFEQARDAPSAAAATEDPELIAARERREQAIASVDPALLEAHRQRTTPQESLFQFRPAIVLAVDRPVALFDAGMLDRQMTIADPREVEISEELRDDLRDCTPQALLRDLHRAEIDFEKTFEIIDMAAEQRLDIVAAVAEAMATSWKLPPLGGSPFVEGAALLAELHAERQQPWTKLLAALPNRRVTE